jgi:methionine-S-sulfoxide reductase
MQIQTAVFGAGCFWGVQAYFDEVPGVVKTTVGYTGGHTANPTYEQVCMHNTGHAEVAQIEFDSAQINYPDLVRHFFRMHDPTQVNRQGPDVGDNYRSAIFYTNEEQKQQAEEVKKAVQKNFEKPIATEITKASQFYPAEEYHQKFFQKTGTGACHIPYAPLDKK